MNLSKIESRTLKTGLEIIFFINVSGSWESALYQNALEELKH
jgi:prephenate dehydratase